MQALFRKLGQTPPGTRMMLAGMMLVSAGVLLAFLLYQAVSVRVTLLGMPEEAIAPESIAASVLAPAPVAVIRESVAPAVRLSGRMLIGFGRAVTKSGEILARRIWFGVVHAADFTGASVVSAVTPLFRGDARP